MNYDDKLLARCTLDRKYVIPLYTTYNAEPVWTGTLHWQTKEPIEQPMIIHMYSKDYLSTYYIHLDRPVHKDWQNKIRKTQSSGKNIYTNVFAER